MPALHHSFAAVSSHWQNLRAMGAARVTTEALAAGEAEEDPHEEGEEFDELGIDETEEEEEGTAQEEKKEEKKGWGWW